MSDLLAALAEGRPLSLGAAAAQADTLPRFAGARVLVADDNAVNREVAAEALGRLGLRVDLVEDGAEAVAACRARAYDLVFMDGSMPVLDGFEATRQIRAAEAAAGAAPLPIVALTAHVIGTASSDWVEAGMNAVLHKPFTLKAMADCITGLLAPRHGPAQAPLEDGKAPPETAAMAARGVSPDEAEAPVIDARTLGELSAFAAAGRSDFVARVVGLYRDHAPKAARDIAARADAGGGEPLAKAAHALKSMSLNIGARRVAALASEIETEAKAGRAPAPDAIERLGVLVAEACAHLARRVDTTPGEDRAPAPRVSGAA